MTALPHISPPPDLLRAAEQKWEQTYVATDWAVMLELWRSIDPANKALALEMADADRRRAQTHTETAK